MKIGPIVLFLFICENSQKYLNFSIKSPFDHSTESKYFLNLKINWGIVWFPEERRTQLMNVASLIILNESFKYSSKIPFHIFFYIFFRRNFVQKKMFDCRHTNAWFRKLNFKTLLEFNPVLACKWGNMETSRYIILLQSEHLVIIGYPLTYQSHKSSSIW